MLGKELVEVMDWPEATALTSVAGTSQKRAKQDSERDHAAIGNVIGGLQAPDNNVPFLHPTNLGSSRCNLALELARGPRRLARVAQHQCARSNNETKRKRRTDLTESLPD